MESAKKTIGNTNKVLYMVHVQVSYSCVMGRKDKNHTQVRVYCMLFGLNVIQVKVKHSPANKYLKKTSVNRYSVLKTKTKNITPK